MTVAVSIPHHQAEFVTAVCTARATNLTTTLAIAGANVGQLNGYQYLDIINTGTGTATLAITQTLGDNATTLDIPTAKSVDGSGAVAVPTWGSSAAITIGASGSATAKMTYQIRDPAHGLTFVLSVTGSPSISIYHRAAAI